MRMSEQDRVEPIDSRAQGLKPEVGPTVDQNVLAFVADQDGRTEPPVSRIGRRADGTFTPDSRHARAGSRTQYFDL